MIWGWGWARLQEERTNKRLIQAEERWPDMGYGSGSGDVCRFDTYLGGSITTAAHD